MTINVEKMGISFAVIIALAGLGLFLISIRIMSSNVKNLSSGMVGNFLKKFSSNKWLALLVGIVFTTMIQSSDGTVALVIGLISAGMLTLRGAIPLILGANIGTATTALIVALGSTARGTFAFIQYLPILIFVAYVFLIFLKEDKKVSFAMVIFAIGTIFLALKVMGAGMKAITATSWFSDIVSSVGFNPWVALVSNTALTGAVQSSSATVTVVQNLYIFSDNSVGPDFIAGAPSMGISSGIAMVIGANIGTTFTALIASIGIRNRDTKKVALIWLTTNVIMTILVMPIIYYYSEMIKAIVPNPLISDIKNETDLASANSALKFQLAWAHMIFNAALVAIFIWLIRPLEWFVNKVIKTKEGQHRYSINLPETLIHENPNLALSAANNAVIELGKMSSDSIKLIISYIKDKNKKTYNALKDLLELIDLTRRNIYSYLITIGASDVSTASSKKQMSLILASRSFERIPLMAKQLSKEVDSAIKRKKNTVSLANQKSLITVLKLIQAMSEASTKQIRRYSSKRSEEIKTINFTVDSLVEKYSKEFVSNKNWKEFDMLLVLKLVSRMAHHCNRVNNYIKRERKFETKEILIPSNLQRKIFKELAELK